MVCRGYVHSNTYCFQQSAIYSENYPNPIIVCLLRILPIKDFTKEFLLDFAKIFTKDFITNLLCMNEF